MCRLASSAGTYGDHIPILDKERAKIGIIHLRKSSEDPARKECSLFRSGPV